MGITIAIATYNRAAELCLTLQSLTRLVKFPADGYEILVIDNASTDATADVTRAFEACFPGRLRFVVESEQGLSHARNRAVAEARFEIVAFLDDDVDVAPGWVRALADAYATGEWAAVGGKAHLVYPVPRPAWLGPRDEGFLTQVDCGPVRRKVAPDEVFGVNLSFRKEWLERVGGFRVDLGRMGNRLFGGEETDVLERIVQAGGTIGYEPSAVVGHRVPLHRLTRRWFMARSFWGHRAVPRHQRPKRAGVYELARTARDIARASTSACWTLLRHGPRSEPFFHDVRVASSELGLWLGYLDCIRARRRYPSS